jgi:hypothetical protein
MATNFSSSESPLVGKYLYVSKLEFDPFGDSWGFECYCLSFNNGSYTVRNKFGKEFKASIKQIEKVIDITVQQKYQIGDIVEAQTEYNQYGGEWITEYCEVISVKNFANDFDYVITNVKSYKIYDVTQQRILKNVTLLQAKYKIGMYVGVKHYEGPQWDTTTVVKNGNILNVNCGYDYVTYSIKYDTGEIDYVSEYNIISPVIKKTKENIELDNNEFLRNEEQRLLQQLEMVRVARAARAARAQNQ